MVKSLGDRMRMRCLSSGLFGSIGFIFLKAGCNGSTQHFLFGLSFPLNPITLFLGLGLDVLNSFAILTVCFSMNSVADFQMISFCFISLLIIKNHAGMNAATT